MAIEHGDIDSMCNLGHYYYNIKNYQQMEVFYLMSINRGDDISLYKLIDYYCTHNKIDKIIHYCMTVVEKFNKQEILDKLLKFYQDNITEFINLISLYKDINKRKGEYTSLIIKELSLNVSHFRFRDHSMGAKIVNYHFRLNNGDSEDAVYQEIKFKDPLILDYLTIMDSTLVTNKIKEYLNSYCHL